MRSSLVATVLSVALVSASAMAQSPSPTAQPSEGNQAAQPVVACDAETPAGSVSREQEAFARGVSLLLSRSSSFEASHADAAGDTVAASIEVERLAGAVRYFADTLVQAEFPPAVQPYVDDIVSTATTEAQQAADFVAAGDVTSQAVTELFRLPLTNVAIQALRDGTVLEYGCPAAWPEIVRPRAPLSAQQMLCSVIVVEPGTKSRVQRLRAFRSIPPRGIGDVRAAVSGFFKRHSSAIKGLEEPLTGVDASEGEKSRWFPGEFGRKRVDRLVKKMAIGNHDSQVPTEDLMMLFTGVFAATDDPQVRRDARKVVATAYGYGSRTLDAGDGLGFWPYITENINNRLRVQLGLDDCYPKSGSGGSFGS